MNKMIIVLLAAVVVVAGATAVVLASDSPEEDEQIALPDKGAGYGLVYGNADGDFDIDETDIKIMEAIIAGEKIKDDFPLADADCDGSVTQKDIDMVRMYLNDTPMRLNVIESNGPDTKVVEVDHPMHDIMLMSGTVMGTVINVFDIYDKLTGVAYNNLDSIRDAPIVKLLEEKKIAQADPDGSAATNDIIMNSHTKILLTELHRMYDIDSDKNVETLNKMGVDVLRLEVKDPEWTLCSVAIMGILFDQTSDAQTYKDFCDNVSKTIKEKEGDKFGTVSMLGYAGPGFSGTSSGYSGLYELAGGNNINKDKGYLFFHPGDQWIYEDKYNVDVYFFSWGGMYEDEVPQENIERWESQFKETPTWKDGRVYLYDYYAPKIVTIAYMAEAFYPDCFEEGWANQVHQDFVDTFYGCDDYKVPMDRFMTKIN